MRTIGTKTLLTALFVVVTLTGTVQAGWWDGVGDAETIDLRDVIESPRKWKGKEIVFECYFHEVSDFYNPYYTRFLPAQYVNFSAWPAGARLWNKEEYSHSFHFLFLEKDHKKFSHLVGTKKFAHLRIRGYVQNTFKNVPWIECRAIEVLEDGFSRDSLREVILGDRAADREQWALALEHYGRAAAASLPEEVMAGLEKKRGQAYEGQGNYEAAMAAYASAQKMDRKDEEVEALLAAVAERLGRPVPTLDMPKAMPEGEKKVMVEARPLDEGRYPPAPMALPAPQETPAEQPVEMDRPSDVEEPTAPERPAPMEPVEDVEQATPEQPVEAPETPPAPKRIKKTPKKRMSGPV
jgi:tetratricopeptide (TPR) repeat protein